MLAIWQTARDLGLAVSCVGNSQSFAAPEFFELVEEFADLPIVLEHFGGTSLPDLSEETSRERLRVFDLAKHPNVYMKVPGLGELTPRSRRLSGIGVPLDSSPKLLQQGLERFGADRLMWGSDFPPVASREGYSNALAWVRSALGDQPLQAQSQIFGATAQRVFRLQN